ncbi:MAG: metal-dependent transcriptional regulator [Melioribacteraceae bacterium]|nr:metal-dependent transcriptional regulator [Melioribacteraceae bacterium]MCF8264968.1 metal-dependent transcriptional regulator [Melioribacteraceae bacterium]MCF8411768.1 metal-dependent transcriptional regulator [Melioribacteraceae bacterium]MCF8431412.1 metal-dependent transcriptional regulator [Melioribacteraceae bacterium]
MGDPILALMIGSAILVIFTFLFFPSKGFYFRWKKSKNISEKVLIEDALKYIYDCEYKNINCTVQSIAGNLEISSNNALDVVKSLQSHKLITSSERLINLTEHGRSYALKVIRIHRLWEKYLADETGVNPADWHDEAESKEHELTEERANELAVQMGNPIKDPHGDPIPNRKGEIPQFEDLHLNSLKANEIATITHIEDEPSSAYSQILALGLNPGMQIKVIQVSSEKIVFEAEGDEKVLAPVFASNISIRKIRKDEKIQENFRNLLSLSKNEKARVIGISRSCRGLQRRRLMDLGIVPGARVSIAIKSPSGNPTAYNIRGASIALRNDQASQIFIEGISQN